MNTETPSLKSRILVIQPDAEGGIDRYGEWLGRAGAQLETIRPFENDSVLPSTLSGYDGLIVLGGGMGDYDTDRFPWLETIRKLLRYAAEHSVPSLGICLGSQLLASALGGNVEKGSYGLETGLVNIQRTDKSTTDPLFDGVAENFLAGAMHYDAITKLPESATLLATGKVYPNQAFRQNLSWGLQFHPEVSPEKYEIWLEETVPKTAEYEDVHKIGATELIKNDSEIRSATQKIAENFVKIVRNNSLSD